MRKLLKKQIIIPVVAVLAIGGGVLAWNQNKSNDQQTTTDSSQTQGENNNNDKDVNYDPPTGEEKNAGNSSKDNLSNDKDNAEPNSNTPKTVTIETTSINQDGSNLMIRTMIQTITDSGACTLTLSRSGSAPITQRVGVQALPQFSTCKGFDISTANLAKGAWQANITFSGKSAVGSTSQSIMIK